MKSKCAYVGEPFKIFEVQFRNYGISPDPIAIRFEQKEAADYVADALNFYSNASNAIAMLKRITPEMESLVKGNETNESILR